MFTKHLVETADIYQSLEYS